MDLAGLMHELGPEFAARAARHDDEDLFVAENYGALKSHGVLAAGIPAELGGGGAEHRELGEMLRVLARYCGSTALALSMHTHQVATAVWRWRHDRAPVEALLRSVAAENRMLVSSGGSDWIAGSGKAERVAGGWRVTARKIFARSKAAYTSLRGDPSAATMCALMVSCSASCSSPSALSRM